jgi:hypothetical protein
MAASGILALDLRSQAASAGSLTSVITDRATGARALVVVVEPQGREDKTKVYSWPADLAIVREAVKCPAAVLLVICPAPREADKCRKVIRPPRPPRTSSKTRTE